jgi:hypothetical protein
MYFQLAARIADAVDILVAAQQQGENDYIEGETPIVYLRALGLCERTLTNNRNYKNRW